MYSTAVFYYIQRQIVVLLYGSSPRSYMPVYAKTLKLHRGVDNRIQFQFLNQQQKPIDVTGKYITFRLLNSEGNRILLSKALDPVLPLTGIMELRILHSELADIVPQRGGYSLEIPEQGWHLPVFVDPASGARGEIDIVDSVLPSFVPSTIVTIPTGQHFPNNSSNTCCSNTNPPSYTYYSSAVQTDGNPIATLQAYYDQYSGNVFVEGSTSGNSGWYQIGTTYKYANLTHCEGYVCEGYHPYVRLKFESTAGAVSNILIR